MAEQAFRRLRLGALVRADENQQLQTSTCASSFEKLTVAPPNEIFNTGAMFNASKHPQKINLGIGAYRTDDGKPKVLTVVKKAEAKILADPTINKEYLGISGHPGFCKVAKELLFGANSPAVKENRICTVQGISGTGSLRLGGELCKLAFPDRPIYISTPTWENHQALFGKCGLTIKPYRYWDAKNRNLDFKGLMEDLSAAPNGAIILLHGCAHNPTGVDPTQDQWKQIANLAKQKQFLPFIDIAYQGFASGDLDKDAWSLRYFVDQGFELIVAQSFAKNLGLYSERVGSMSVVCSSADRAKAVQSQVELVIRPMYSNPPSHGALIVHTVLSDPALFKEWKQELVEMSSRIHAMRDALRSELVKLGTPGNWDHIVSQIGMFSYTGLTAEQVEVMQKKHHVYLLKSGRISMAGVNTKNVQYLAKAIDDVVRNVK